jgi:hypothetical protein
LSSSGPHDRTGEVDTDDLELALRNLRELCDGLAAALDHDAAFPANYPLGELTLGSGGGGESGEK